jgi:hypothetical protein
MKRKNKTLAKEIEGTGHLLTHPAIRGISKLSNLRTTVQDYNFEATRRSNLVRQRLGDCVPKRFHYPIFLFVIVMWATAVQPPKQLKRTNVTVNITNLVTKYF